MTETYNQKKHEMAINIGLSRSKDDPKASIEYWEIKRFNFINPDTELNDEVEL